MASQDAKDFHARMHSDQALHDKVKAASESVLAIAQEEGLSFTREELAEVLKTHWAEGAGEDDDGADPATSFISERPGF